MDLNAWANVGASWAQTGINLAGAGLAQVSEHAAQAINDVDWEEVGAKMGDAANTVRDSASMAYQQAEEAIKNVDWQEVGSKMGDAATTVAKSATSAYHLTEETINNVDWDDLGVKLGDAANTARESAHGAYQQTKKNPKLLYIPVGVVAGAAVAPVVMGPTLAAIGFSSIGPVAGSIAAGMQSAGFIGTSACQSAAMFGYAYTPMMVAFAASGGAAGGVVGAAAQLAENENKND